MLEFTGSICLRMNIADLLHLEASLKTDSIVYTASDEECVLSAGKLVCIPLDALLVLKNLFNLVGDSIELFKKLSALFLCHLSACNSKLHSKKISSDKLSTVCLGCSNRYLGACQCIEHIVCFTGNG